MRYRPSRVRCQSRSRRVAVLGQQANQLTNLEPGPEPQYQSGQAMHGTIDHWLDDCSFDAPAGLVVSLENLRGNRRLDGVFRKCDGEC